MIDGYTTYSEEEASRVKTLMYTLGEIQQITSNTELYIQFYINNYKGRELSESWAKRKGMDRHSFWKGLDSKNGLGMFTDLFTVKFLPKKHPTRDLVVYQVDYFDVAIGDNIRFRNACDSINDRRFLPNNEVSFNAEGGTVSTAFCNFISSLNIQSAIEIGLGSANGEI
jgi:hypothetical protein